MGISNRSLAVYESQKEILAVTNCSSYGLVGRVACFRVGVICGAFYLYFVLESYFNIRGMLSKRLLGLAIAHTPSNKSKN